MSLFSPLGNRNVARLWIVNLISNIGTFTQVTAAMWLIKQYNSSNLDVGLVHVISSIPMFFFGIIAGILIDKLDKRKYLVITNLYMALVAFGLGLAVQTGHDSPTIILAFSFLNGIGTALTAPAWQATMSILVSREQIKSLAILNGISFNFGNILGAMLAGFILTISVSYAFYINTITYLVLALVFYSTIIEKNTVSDINVMKNGNAWYHDLVLLLNNKSFRFIVVITFFAFLFHSYIVLTPIIVLDRISSNEIIYGQIMAFSGVGALAAGFLLPKLLQLFKDFYIIIFANFLAVLNLMLINYWLGNSILFLFSFLSGFCFVVLIASLNGISQYVVSSKFRGKAIGLYLSVMYAGTSLGGMITSLISEAYSPATATTYLVICLLCFSVIVYLINRKKILNEEYIY